MLYLSIIFMFPQLCPQNSIQSHCAHQKASPLQIYYEKLMQSRLSSIREYGNYFEDVYESAALIFNKQFTERELKQHRIRIIPEGHPRRGKSFVEFQSVSYTMCDASITSFLVFIGKFQVEVIVHCINANKQSKESRIGVGGFGEVFEIDYGKGEKYAEKVILPNKPNAILSAELGLYIRKIDLVYALSEVAILKILAMYGIGPQVPLQNEIDIVCGNNFILFFMGICKELQLKNSLQFSRFYKEMKTKLLAMHALGIAHKDIKPQNMMKYKDSYVFIDFGISQYMENGPEALHSTYYEGTPVYMSRQMYELSQSPLKKQINLHYNDYCGFRKSMLEINRAVLNKQKGNKLYIPRSDRSFPKQQACDSQNVISSNSQLPQLRSFSCNFSDSFPDNICKFQRVLGEFLFKDQISEKSQQFLNEMNQNSKSLIVELLLKSAIPDELLATKIKCLKDSGVQIDIASILNQPESQIQALISYIKIFGISKKTEEKIGSFSNITQRLIKIKNLFNEQKILSNSKQCKFKSADIGNLTRSRQILCSELIRHQNKNVQRKAQQLFNIYFQLIRTETNKQKMKRLIDRLKDQDLNLSKTEELLIDLLQKLSEPTLQSVYQTYQKYEQSQQILMRKQDVLLFVCQSLIEDVKFNTLLKLNTKFEQFQQIPRQQPLKGRWYLTKGVFQFLLGNKKESLASLDKSRSILVNYYGNIHPNLIEVYKYIGLTSDTISSRIGYFCQQLSILIKYELPQLKIKIVQCYCRLMDEYLNGKVTINKQLLQIISLNIIKLRKYILQDIKQILNDHDPKRKAFCQICESLCNYFVYIKQFELAQRELVRLLFHYIQGANPQAPDNELSIQQLYKKFLKDDINALLIREPTFTSYLRIICKQLKSHAGKKEKSEQQVFSFEKIFQSNNQTLEKQMKILHYQWLAWLNYFLNDRDCISYCKKALNQDQLYKQSKRQSVNVQWHCEQKKRVHLTVSSITKMTKTCVHISITAQIILLKYKLSVYCYQFQQIKEAREYGNQAVEGIRNSNIQTKEFYSKVPLIYYQLGLCESKLDNFESAFIHAWLSLQWYKWTLQNLKISDEYFSEQLDALIEQLVTKIPVYQELLSEYPTISLETSLMYKQMKYWSPINFFKRPIKIKSNLQLQKTKSSKE